MKGNWIGLLQIRNRNHIFLRPGWIKKGNWIGLLQIHDWNSDPLISPS